ncbi:MAG TPA: acyl-CoA dehydrogenase [Cycloclasticus sp.]|jgi:alkylation response protein AidB-like acyl-CoA dehydrogenase|nr:acyl-CoA dehydrogenase [Cycloclasticus sp.]HIL93232.1 acyl-CoA dehydrogenase [Cycloclasticus sp.]
MAVIEHDEWIRRAELIGKKAEPMVAEAEKAGCFPLELRDYVHELEMHKALRPLQYGGSGIGAFTFSEIVRTIANYNASAAWLVYFVVLHEQWVAFLDEKGRQEVYDSNKFTGDIFMPLGQIEYVDGGVKMSGQWSFGSGVLWNDWMGLGAIVQIPGEDPQPCLVNVEKAQLEVIEDWNPFGLRGTGSHSVKVNDVFVPWHRILPVLNAKNKGEPVGGHYSDEPIFKVPFMAFFCLGFPAISTGIAQRVARDLKVRVEGRQRILYNMKEWESPIAQRNLAEVMVRVDAIEAMNTRYINQLEEWIEVGTPVVAEEEKNKMSAWRSHIGKEASDLAFHAMNLLGASATGSGDPLETAARDAFMVYIHLGQIYEDNMMAYGRTQFGLSGHPLL